MDKIKLTPKEAELINAIRNFRKGYPRSRAPLYFIQQLFEELLDADEDED